MRKLIVAGVAWGLATAGPPAWAQAPAASPYHYVLPLSLALEAATEAVRVCGLQGWRVTATVVDMDGVPQVALRETAPPCTRECRASRRPTPWSRWVRNLASTPRPRCSNW